MKYCQHCDYSRARFLKHKFCIECGEELSLLTDTCPSCNYHIQESDYRDEQAVEYCPMCGESLEVEEDG